MIVEYNDMRLEMQGLALTTEDGNIYSFSQNKGADALFAPDPAVKLAGPIIGFSLIYDDQNNPLRFAAVVNVCACKSAN